MPAAASNNYPPKLEALITALRRLPGVGARTAERYALAFMDWHEDELKLFGEQLATLKGGLRACSVCGNLADQELCRICRDPNRNREIICVVEQAGQIPVIERCGYFKGLYHVLGGRILPLENKGPSDIRLAELRQRVEQGGVRELILATNPDTEGEATAAFIADDLKEQGVAISRIASGVPVGADIGFADAATMAVAMRARHALVQAPAAAKPAAAPAPPAALAVPGLRVQPLPKAEIVKAISGQPLADRVPVMIHLWVHPDTFGERRAAVEQLLAQYPQDVNFVHFRMPGMYDAPAEAPSYRWMNIPDPYAGSDVAIDARIALPDWDRFDAVLADWPDPAYHALIPAINRADSRYRLGHWWFCLFERHWSLRGMTNALTDYYTDPEQVHRLFRACTDFYKAVITRGRNELQLDGIFTSDDLGTQTGPFFSPAIFREFFKPYYRELVEHAHSLGMHFWLHACGNIEPFIPEFVDIGLDVLHPIQKHTMDERRIAEQFGGKLCIWAGLDVQQVIPWGTPEQVRAEVRHLMDSYCRTPQSRFMLTAGNGINGDCTLASLEAFLDEAFSYGRRKVAALRTP